MSDAPGSSSRQTFRSPFAVVIWWLWVLFAAGNLIDLAVQGRNHLAVVAAFILLLVTGVVYTTALRPRVVADDAGMTIVNPLRDHRAGWGAVAGIDSAGLLRVRCEWPLDGAGAAGTGQRVIYAWAVQARRRRQAAQPHADTSDQPPAAGDAEQVLAVLTTLAGQGRAAAGTPATAPVSMWSRPAIAAIVIPALALAVAVLR